MALLLLLQVLAVGVVAHRLAPRLARPGAPAADVWLARLVLALTQVVGTAQLLAAVHLFSRGFLVGAHVALAAAVLWRLPARPAPMRRPVTWPGALVAALATSIGALAVVFGLDGRSLEADTVQYHAPNAGFWATHHSLWDPPFAAPGYLWAGYPSNLELSAAWWILPVGSDVGVYAINAVWGALLVLAVAVLARTLGAQLWVGALAGLALVLTPLVFATQVHSLSTDLAASAGIVAALAILLAAREHEPHRWWWVLPGCALGLSLGSKYTAVVPAAAVVAGVALVAPRAASVLQRMRRAAAVGGLASAFLVVWLARNWIRFGNPLFPLEVTVGDRVLLTGADTVLDRYETSMLHHVVQLSGDPLRTWWSMARSLIGPALVLLVGGIAGGLLSGWRGDRARSRLIVAAVAVVSLGSYLATPYTGGGEQGAAFLIGSQLRYSLVAQALAAALFAAVVPRVVAVPVLVGTVAWGAQRLLEGPGFRTDLDLTMHTALLAGAIATLAGVVWVALAVADGPVAQRRPATAVASLALLVALGTGWAARDRADVPADTAAVLAEARTRGPILVVSAQDVRALFDRQFRGRLEKVSDGGVADERVLLDGAALEARVEAAHPALVVVGAADILLPPGWVPPARWTPVGRLGPDTYYALAEP